MCQLWAGKEFQNFLCGGKKLKHEAVGCCRQKVCPNVDIYTCRFDVLRSIFMVVLSSLTLAANVLALGEGGDFLPQMLMRRTKL